MTDIYIAVIGLSLLSVVTTGLGVVLAILVRRSDVGVALGMGWRYSSKNPGVAYKGGDQHYGRCGTYVERQEALHLVQVPDPTKYEDSDYWVDMCRQKDES